MIREVEIEGFKSIRKLRTVIDEDPASAQPSYLRNARLIEENHGVRVLEDPQRGHRILMLCPRLEGWILQVARRNGIRPEDHRLPLMRTSSTRRSTSARRDSRI